MGNTTLGVKVDDQVRRRLKALGEIKDRSPHWLLKAAIMEYLEKEEQAEQERCEDLERWQRYMDGGQAVGNEQAMQWLAQLEQGQQSECPR